MGDSSDRSKCTLLTKRLEISRNPKKSCSSRCVFPSKNAGSGAAIATQVISPRAIGGSMSSRQSFGFSSTDEDRETFLAFRRHRFYKVCKNRLCFYGLSTAALLLIMTGTIVCLSCPKELCDYLVNSS